MKNKGFMVSVIVPIYNGSKYLNKCIDSILNQTYIHLEVILVDDGSTDESLSICENYVQMDKRVVIIHKGNGGLSDARNAGLQVAQGAYITFVDCDDYIHKDMIYCMVREMQRYDADIVACGMIRVREEERIDINCEIDLYDIKIYNRDEALLRIHEDVNVTAWGKLFKSKLFKSLRFEVGKYHEDEFIIHQLIYQCRRVVSIQNGYYFYVAHQNSIMAHFSYKRLKDAENALISRIYFVKEHNWGKVFDFTVATFFEYIVPLYAKPIESEAESVQELLMRDARQLFADKEIRKHMNFDERIFCVSPRAYFKLIRAREGKNRVRYFVKKLIRYNDN